MYVPPHFKVTDPIKLREFLHRHSFATLISTEGQNPVATHLPLLLDESAEEPGKLLGHFARANNQWETVTGQKVLAIFSGPHAYISPSWYESTNVVPTWNYVAVHVYGKVNLIDDQGRLKETMARMAERYESTQANPWSLDSDDDVFVSRMLDAIVGFEIEIERIEGKWKLSQNHSVDRREKVVRHLNGSTNSESQEIARLMSISLES